MLAYHVTMNPYQIKEINILAGINEATFVICGAMFFLFSDDSLGQSKSDLIGWVLLALILVVISANLLVAWYFQLKQYLSEINKYYNDRNERIRMKNIPTLQIVRPNLPKEVVNQNQFNRSSADVSRNRMRETFQTSQISQSSKRSDLCKFSSVIILLQPAKK